MSAQHTPVARITLAKAVDQFKAALAAMPVIAKRVDAGQQFNCYEQAGNGDDVHPDYWKYSLCVGPITNASHVHDVLSERHAALFEAAFKVATEAYRNARLIALAPEMVAMLREVAEGFALHNDILDLLAKIDGEG